MEYLINKKLGTIKTNRDYPEKNIMMLVTGDIYPNKNFETNLAKNNLKSLIINNEVLTDMDYILFNLETVIYNEITKENMKRIPKGGPNFKINEKLLKSFTELNFNIACLANNHSLDYGEYGINSTINNLKKLNIEHIGEKTKNKNTISSKEIYVENRKYTFINLGETEGGLLYQSTLNDLNEKNLLQNLKKIIANSDYTCLIFAGGREYVDYPLKYLREKLRSLIDIGIDLIIGHHPHVIQGMENYKNKYIFYSLGNFMFDMEKFSKNHDVNRGICLKFDLTKFGFDNFKIIPILIKPDEGKIILDPKKQKEKILKHFFKLSENLGDEKFLNNFENRYVEKLKKTNFINMYCSALLISNSETVFQRLKKLIILNLMIIKNIFNFSKQRSIAWNMTHTDSHSEIIKQMTEDILDN